MIWVCLALAVIIGYSLIGYPMLALAAASMRPRPIAVGPETPPVTLFIAARNEAADIAERIRNAEALTYPDLRIVVVSDGSTDATVAESRQLASARVCVMRLEHPVGKTAAVTAAVKAHGRPGIYAFSDATAVWEPTTLSRLVEPFADASVGAVSGWVSYAYPNAPVSRGFRAYQSLEVPLRRAESCFASVTSVSGSISAVRSSLWHDAPPQLSYDLAHPLHVVASGYRAVLHEAAVSREVARDRPRAELRSRVRLALSAFSFVAHLRSRRREIPVVFLWAVCSHKVLRWLTPHLALLALLALIITSPAWGLGCAVISGLALLTPPGVFAGAVAAGYIIGSIRYLAGERPVGWEPGEQR